MHARKSDDPDGRASTLACVREAAPWEQAEWLDSAVGWIDERLAELGLEAAGSVEQRLVRPWSTLLVVPASGGDLWFKACMPALAHEVTVVEVLGRRRPDALPELLAVDRERGWMLQRHGGTQLREVLEREPGFGRWQEILPLYAELQLDAAADAGELLRAGAPDRRLERLPAAFEELLGTQRGLARGEAEGLLALAPRVRELCAELAGIGVPETIQHDDLHSGNVLVRDGGYAIVDWGDACVAHPFLTLHVTMRVLAYELGLDEGAPELDRYRDAYLEPWTRLARRDDLLRALGPALALGALGRALNWQVVADAVPAAERGEYDEIVADRLRLLASSL
jgi:hypothetical protein